MAEYILAHELGTSGDKATLFGTDGKMIGSRTCPYDIYYDQPLWAEQDANAWWNAVCGSTRELLSSYGILGDEVKAISFSGQMMGCLPVDRPGNPLHRAIIWADQRAQKQSALLAEKIDDDRFYHIVGHRNTASYGIQKAMWLKENKPDIYENIYKFLNAKDYIVFRLTGKFYTDCSDANSMTCFDLAKRQWSDEIVAASEIDPDKLPEIVESTFVVGNVTEEAAALTGLSVHTKVVMGAGDGVAANVGAGCVKPGSAYLCLGTSAWVAGTSEKPILDEQRRIVCWAHAVPGMYSPNGTMQYAGGSYKWLKETICHEEIKMAEEKGGSPYEIMNERIASCAPGAEGVIFLPYLLGERAPRWNPDAKGVFYGITATTTREQMLRSVMEGIIMNLGICFDILGREEKIKELLLIGGAARSSQWQKGIADIFGCTVLVPKYLEEAGSMGAAVIAGVGSGIYKDFSAIDQFIQVQKKVEPDEAARKIYAPLREKFEEVYQALKPVKPSYNSKQALVKTISCGICSGTDEKLIHRTFKGVGPEQYPLMLGHEAVGEVIEVGSEVKGYHIGDKVLLPFVDPDLEKYGELDSAWGGYSEYAVVNDATAFGDGNAPECAYAQTVLPDFVDPVDAAMIVTLREVLSSIKRFGIKENSSIAVFGCGPVGLTFIRFMSLLGVHPIIAFDMVDEKVQDALSKGADYAFNSKNCDPNEEIHKICPDGVQFVLDAVGLLPLINASMEYICDGGKMCCYGIAPKCSMEIDWAKAPYNWQLQFQQFPSKAEEGLATNQILAWLKTGVIDLKDYISDYFKFDDILGAFEKLEKREIRKKGIVVYD